MGEIEEFLKVDSGSGFGSGFGDGSGDGYGSGDGSGSGFGSGFGSGSGFGDGSGDGYGSGSGSGNGFGDGINTFCGKKVYIIDDMQTIIESVRGNIAKGYILQSDLTLTPCHVVKENGKFAHGNTLREARSNACKSSASTSRISQRNIRQKNFLFGTTSSPEAARLDAKLSAETTA